MASPLCWGRLGEGRMGGLWGAGCYVYFIFLFYFLKTSRAMLNRDTNVCVCQLLSHVQLFATPQTAAHQAPPSMGYSRQEHWSGLPFPSRKETIERKKVKSLSHVQLFATLQTVAYQAPPSMEFSRQGYWSGLPFPSPGTLIAGINLKRRDRIVSKKKHSNTLLPFLHAWTNLFIFFDVVQSLSHVRLFVTL